MDGRFTSARQAAEESGRRLLAVYADLQKVFVKNLHINYRYI